MNGIYDVVDTYQVIDNQSVFLSVMVGNGQLRYHLIRLNLEKVGVGYYYTNFRCLACNRCNNDELRTELTYERAPIGGRISGPWVE